MIKKLTFIFLVLLVTGCKTFIIKGEKVEWKQSDYSDFNLMTDDMCIINRSKTDDSSACYDKSATRKVTQLGNSYIFPIKKKFIENAFQSSSLENELKGKFKFKTDKNEVHALMGIVSLFSDTVKHGIQDIERNRKKKYIRESIQSLFYTAYNRFDNNYNDDTVGLGINLIRYTSPLNSESGTYELAEVFFVDMKDSTIIGETVYGYVDFFKAGHGGFNVFIPTCYTYAIKRIDGCEFNDIEMIKKWVRKSQKRKEGYGKPVFEMSLSSYIPPPEQPRAKGIPLDF